MLEVAAKFHTYSPMCQRPEATRMAGYRAWQSLGRQVSKSERGIAILAPCVYRAGTETDEADEARARRQRLSCRGSLRCGADRGRRATQRRRFTTRLDGEAPTGLWEALAAQVAHRPALVRGDCGSANPDLSVSLSSRHWQTLG